MALKERLNGMTLKSHGEGSYSHSVLPSLVLTAKRQGKHLLGFFQTLFTSDTATAQAALYDGSS